MSGFDDFIQDSISRFSVKIRYEDLDEEVIRECKYRVLDSIAVSIASLPFEATRRARSAYIDLYPVPEGSTIWFSSFKTIPEYAGFINSLMTRALDFNDTYLSKEPLHPSDMIGVLYSAAEYLSLPPEDFITSIAVGYEVGITLCDSGSLRTRGWDHVNYTMIGAVAGLSNLLGLSSKEAGEALAIAVVPHAAMRQTRAGKITMWKAAAAADACRHGFYATYLASTGFEGPYQPFTGEMGFLRQLGVELDPNPIKRLVEIESPRSILRSYMKFHPVEYHAQSAVDAAMEVWREREVRLGDVEKVVVGTTQASYDIIVKHPEKWRPENRETADHSLPYIVAYTLLNGGIWLDAYSKDNLFSEEIRSLMGRMEVYVDEELNKRYPEEVPNKIIVKFRDGEVVEKTVYRPRGFPGSGYDVEKLLIDKARKLLGTYFPSDRVDEIIDVVLNLEKHDLEELSELLVI